MEREGDGPLLFFAPGPQAARADVRLGAPRAMDTGSILTYAVWRFRERRFRCVRALGKGRGRRLFQ